MKRFASLGWLALVLWIGGLGCKKSGGTDPADGATDAAGERPVIHCAEIDAGAQSDASARGNDAESASAIDEFGPNAPAAKAASSLGRVNVYEVTSPRLLERVDIYLRADLDHTRMTIAVQEATTRSSAFVKVSDIQIDVVTCEGWATSGPLAIPLEVGHFYAIGFDPNQVVTTFVSGDTESLPIDGKFGRLIGSKTASSVSVPSITWDKLTDKEYNRQRMVTSPRAGGPSADGGAVDSPGSAADASDGGGVTDVGRDGADMSRG